MHPPQRHPSTSGPPNRAFTIIADMRAEYEAALNENKSYHEMRRDFHRKFEAQLAELEKVERSLASLEETHTKYKAEADAEIARLKAHLAHRASDPAAPSLPNQDHSLLPQRPTVPPAPAPVARALPHRLPAPIGESAVTVATGGYGSGVGFGGGRTYGGAGYPGYEGAGKFPRLGGAAGATSAPLPSLGDGKGLGRGRGGMGMRRGMGTIPGGRGRGGRMQNRSRDTDWEVTKGRVSDGTQVNMDLQLQHSLKHDSVVCCVRFSWDGRYFATGSNRTANIYDANTGAEVSEFVDRATDGEDPQDSYVRAVCFSPDGKWLITGAEDHIVKIWDVRNRTVRHRLKGHSTDIYSVDASQDSRFIISGSGDKTAKLWNLETGRLLTTLGEERGPTDGITSVSVSPLSTHVAAGSLDKIVRVWDVESTQMVRAFEGHEDSVYSVAFSPDGRTLLSGSLDKTLKLWDLGSGQSNGSCRLSFSGHKDFVLSVTFSPNGRWLISGSKDRTVQFWDPRQSTVCLTLQGHKNSVISIAHNPRSSHVATGSGDCRARTWYYEYAM